MPDRVDLDAAPASALARCVPDPEAFLTEAWGRRVVLCDGADAGGYADLLSLDDVDRLVTSSGLRAPAFRLVKAGAPLPTSTYLREARVGSRPIHDLVDVGRVYAEFEDGATIVLQGLHRYWPPLAAFCRDLELTLSHPVQANAYITPPVASGLNVHGDPHDVFALQTFGRKHWVVYEGGDGRSRAGATGETPSLDVHLRAGDALYLPRGTRHAARTVDEPSAHITIGVRPTTWGDVLRRVARRVAADARFAERLPAGWARDPVALAEAVAGRLEAFSDRVEALDPAEVAVAERRRFTAAREPHLRGMLPDLLALERIRDATPVRRRPGSVCEVEVEGEQVRVTLGDRTLHMPGVLAAAMSRLATMAPGDTLRAADLDDLLDPAGRLVLVRRLVREGLLSPADSGLGA